MLLKFLAKDDLLVTVPDAVRAVGQPLARVGRNADGSKSESPFVCDSDSDVGRRLVQLMRREQSLVPVDAATAAACGVEFVEAKTSQKADY